MSAQTTASDIFVCKVYICSYIYIYMYVYINCIVHRIDMSDNNNGKRNSDRRKKG